MRVRKPKQTQGPIEKRKEPHKVCGLHTVRIFFAQFYGFCTIRKIIKNVLSVRMGRKTEIVWQKTVLFFGAKIENSKIQKMPQNQKFKKSKNTEIKNKEKTLFQKELSVHETPLSVRETPLSVHETPLSVRRKKKSSPKKEK